MNVNGKTIWITGASSGIGEALAIELSKSDVHLILSSRSQEALEEVASRCGADKCTVVLLDLTMPDSIQAALNSVQSKFSTVDVLVNNGGVSQRATVLETSIETERKLMEVNYWGAIQLTKGILPLMIKNGGGMFVTITSVVGKFGFRLRSTYASSKHALHGYFDSLRAEYHDDNIRVCLVCPGRILTNVSQNAMKGDGTKHAELDPGQKNGLSAEYCAQQIVKAIQKEKKEIFIARGEKWLWQIKRFMPWLYYRLAAKLSPK